jgi:DNA helicase-2/ATP-dependent DNA helicase PcrA
MTWPTDLFDGLTEAQRQAVVHLDGPLLVLAGPGSGKTTVVTRRVANLIANGIPPWQILALTFTNKAAAEMRERVAALLPPDLPGLRGLTVSTFHSFGARLLRRYAEVARLAPGYTIYDQADQRDAIKRAIAAASLSSTNWAPGSVAIAMSDAKNHLLTAAEYAESAGDFYTRSVGRIFTHYERILADADALDFDDLLCRTARLLRADANVRRELQERYRYLLIDEYQDTNHAQFVIAHELVEAHRNICVVGDPDQSIYGWRGADISNILEFESHYAETAVVPLGQNFRSTGHIVAAAAGLIEHNHHRKAKRLFTELDDGAKPRIWTARDEHEEAAMIAGHLREHAERDGVPWREMAVLYRINALSRVLEDALRDEGIPYVIARGTAFYERKEVKDALAYLRVVHNPRDEVSLRRIVNTPTRGIGRTTLQKIEAEARLENLAELVSAAAGFAPEAMDDEDAGGAIAAPIAGLPPLRAALAGFLESVALVSDADAVDATRGAVTLMTLHTAKGLEFDVVAVAGLEAGLLPHARASATELGLEEERRLCFVGLTRARRHLHLSNALIRTHRGIRERTIPSPFLAEISEDAVVREEPPDLFDPAPVDDFDLGGWGDLSVGCRVRHPSFGVGRIESVTPRPRGSAARVAFETAGVKTLILEYAKLERIE